jgi:LuxR family transcriptional regulator, maltose regulon positive regulatory protein
MTVALPVGTRTSVPRLPEPWVRRPRLNARLMELHPGDVMLVAAFAGSGKTTMLADWYTHDRVVDGAWLALEARDNEPGRFAALVAHALGLEALGPQRRSRRGDVLAIDRVLEALEGVATPRVLVIDDAHELTAPEALQALDQLVHRASSELAVVIATRADPPLPLRRLALEGRLHQIRTDELALTLREAEMLFEAHGLTLARDEVRSLHDRTAGWAAGLRLAALVLADERDPSRFVADTVQTDAAMSEYLMEEVLQRLPEDVQRFLLRTSVAQPLTVELAALLSDDAASEEKLAMLERTGVFVSRPDRPDGEYRFHALFDALLHARLRFQQPELERELCGRAAAWFDAHDMPAEAEASAFGAGDWQLGSRLACRRWVQGILRGVVYGVELDLPPTAPRGDVGELALLAAIDATVAADRREATMWRTRADTLLGPHHEERTLSITRLLLDVFFGRAFGADARSIAACHALRDAELETPGDTALLHAVGRLREAEVLLDTDDEEGTLRALLDARIRGNRAAAPWIVGDCDALIALIAAVRGRLDVCATLFPQLQDSAADMVDTLRLARALCDAQHGRLQSARALLVAELTSPSAAHAVRAGLAEAARRLEVLSDRQPYEPGAASAFAANVRIALGSIDDAAPGTPERDVATARALLARNRPAQVLELLGDGTGATQVHLRTRIEELTLVAIAADRTDNPAAALSALRRALELAAPADLRAPFLNYTPTFGEVVDRYSWQLAGETRYAVGLLDDLHRDELPAFLEPLTERERAVLDYLPTMMSNAEIAQQLLVSVNTVKTHLKAVYRKLGVERRRDAVIRARQLELL